MMDTILVVEDEGLIALHIEEILSRAGYRVLDPLPSGEEAIAFLEAGDGPDLILMDIGLAGEMSGIEAARKIRERSGIPVIFLTAYTDAGRAREAEALSPCARLAKPFTERDLLAAVAENLRRGRQVT